MPLFTQDPLEPVDQRTDIAPPSADPFAAQAQPTNAGIVGAAIREGNNPFISAANAIADRQGGPDPNHNPLDIIRGTRYESEHLSEFIGSANEQTTRGIMARIDQADADRATLAKSGPAGTVAMLGSGLLDPTMYIPFVDVAKAAEEGMGAARVAYRAAILGGLQSATSELALQASANDHTWVDSLGNIATSTLMMGLLGGGIGFLSRSERAAAADGLEAARHDFTPDASPGELPTAEATPAPSYGYPAPAGAAPADNRQLIQKPFAPVPQALRDAVPVVDKAASAFESGVDQLSPIGRIFGGDSLEARRAAADLVETVRTFRQNADGIPTTLDGLPPVSRVVRQQVAGGLIDAEHILTDAYVDYRYGDNAPSFPNARAAMQDLIGQTPAGKMSFRDFSAAVTEAGYSGDTHSIPQVAQAAQRIRQTVLDPVKGAGQRTIGPDGLPLYGADMEAPAGDQSFWPRTWNKVAIAAKRNKFVSTVTDWLQSEQARKAAIQDRIQAAQTQRQTLRQQLSKIEARIATVERRQTETAAQMKERAVELNAADARSTQLESQHDEIRQNLSEIEEFIATMQREHPEASAAVHDLSLEVQRLRGEDRPMSRTAMAQADRDEVQGTFPDDSNFRTAAEVFVGQRNAPKEDTLLNYLVRNGGVVGDQEAREALRDVRRPGLLRRDRQAIPGLNGGGVVRGLDDWGEKLAQDFPHGFPEGRPSPSEVANILREAASGRDPWWFKEDASGPLSEATHVNQGVEQLHELFDRLGQQKPTNLKDLARVLNGESGVSHEDILRELEQMDAAGARVPPSIEREAGEDRLASARAWRDEIRSALENGRKGRDAAEREGVKAGIREREAGVAITRSENRFEQLQGRANQHDLSHDLLHAARSTAADEYARLTEQIEEELRNWGGNSAAEAVQALKARDEAERIRGLKQEAGVYGGKGERLTSADGAVDRAVKRILESDRRLSRQELSSRAEQTADRLLGSPDGRLPYDDASVQPEGFSGQELRGALNRRSFAIPTSQVKEFVEHDALRSVGDFLRTTVPDIALTQRFGDVRMTEALRKINEEFAAKASRLTSEKALTKLEKQRQSTIRDLTAMRDRVRGIYGWSPDPRLRQAARLANVFRNWNMLADLGTSVVNRFGDMTNAVFRYGFTNVLNDVYRPYLKSMMGMSELGGAARRQAVAMRVGVDGMLGHMAHSVGDVIDNYRPGTKFERFLAWAADRSMLVNLHGPWTDWTKTMASTAAAAEFLRTAEKIANGTAKPAEIERMAAANISPEMARRIWQAHVESGVEKIDGVHVPNTGDWKDMQARQSFEAAMAREADISVITAGQEKPLWMSHPIASLLGQFKSFIAGANERLLVANLQQRDARTLQGLITAIATGMLSYRLYTLLSGEQASDRPQDWLKEGIQRSAIAGWFTEINAMQAKFTGGKTDAYRLIGADRPLSRYAQRSALAEVLGPTYSRLEGLSGALGDAMMTDKSGRSLWSAADTHKLRQLLWMQNLFAVRRLFDMAEDGINSSMGVKPRDRSGTIWGPH